MSHLSHWMFNRKIDDLEAPPTDDDDDMAGELKGLPIPDESDDDRDPTLVLHCARCRLPYEACGCQRGPVRWPRYVDKFEPLHPKDADQ